MKKIIGFIFLGLIVASAILYFSVNESKPDLKPSPEADEVADKIMSAMDKPAWDRLPFVSWSFRNAHHYVWDKVNNNASIQWDDYEVLMDLDEVQGKITKAGVALSGEEAEKIKMKAWSLWCNDSYWLAAPYKLKDEGTQRGLVENDGKQGLLVQYSHGGVTPGDQYLWFYDENYMPTGYKMWVSIIPFGGVYSTWEDYAALPGGAKVAQKHLLKLPVKSFNVSIDELKGGESLADLGKSETLFDQLN